MRLCKCHSLHRVYFYDAPPLTKTVHAPLQGGKVDLAEFLLAKNNQALHKALVRMGDLRFRGWQFKEKNIPKDCDQWNVTADDFQPVIQQKGVDMRIGLDIASLVLKKQVDMIAPVSGDSDFVPPIKFARREGVQIATVFLGHRVNQDLITHSDFMIELQ